MDLSEWKAYRRAKPGPVRDARRARLIREHEALAQAYVSRYCEGTAYYTENLREDLLQAARIGLLRALDEWKPSRGAFSLCAFFWTRHEMQLVVRHATGVSVPKGAFLPKKKQDEIARFETMHGRAPTPEEVGIAPSAVERHEKAMATFVPVDQADHVPIDPSAPTPEADIDRARDAAALKEFVGRLSVRDRREFWTGTREDLTERAKRYVEGKRVRS